MQNLRKSVQVQKYQEKAVVTIANWGLKPHAVMVVAANATTKYAAEMRTGNILELQICSHCQKSEQHIL
jgi:hypothetical protein